MLKIVQWNAQNPHRAADSFHLGSVEIADLTFKDGQGIAQICKERGVTIEAYMQAFPGRCLPRDWVSSDPYPLSWDVPLDTQLLPDDDDGMRRLATMLGEDLEVYAYERRIGFHAATKSFRITA